MVFSRKSIQGSGFVILNVIRAMNIISLMAVVAASVVMLVKTFIISKFFFFDAISHVITAFTSMFLIVSECHIFRSYFARNWPLLSPEHGFVTLGVAMMVLGLNILGNLNKEATSQESLGLAFWRIVIASGILVLILGFFNVVASYIFRDKARNITARNIRSHGAVAQPTPKLEHSLSVKGGLSIRTDFQKTSLASSSIYSSPKQESPSGIRSPLKAFTTLKEASRRARHSILPSYYSSPSRNTAAPPYPDVSPIKKWKGKKEKRESVGPRVPINISGPLNIDTRYEHLVSNPGQHPSARQPDLEEGKSF